MSKLLMTFALVAALTACATPQPSPSVSGNATAAPSAQSGAPAAPVEPIKPKLVCDDTARIDSHFQQRVCMTPEQAEARRKAAQADMQNLQNGSVCAQGGSGSACGGPPR